MSNTPKLSIITVNLNNAPGLCKTLDSVAAQTFTDFEHIVIDGGSTDGGNDLVSALKLPFSCVTPNHRILIYSGKLRFCRLGKPCT